jgi:rhamnulokinase
MVRVIAVDLGAESGRIITVDYDGDQLTFTEVLRFANVPVRVRGTLHWDVLRLWHDIAEGIKQVGKADGVGVDTWGVDFALLDKDGNLLGNPVHYRDEGKVGALAWTLERIPRRELFQRTGIQFMEINGLYQLASMLRDQKQVFSSIGTVFTMPDLFHYWLSGQRVAELTNASTTQAYDLHKGDWDAETLKALGIPRDIFPPIVPPGTKIGEYNGIPVITPACHDTGSAVVAIPTTTRDYAYISSGTWSLIGLENDAPIVNDAAYEANVTNEGGYNNTFRFLKNVMGLWLAQQCRATWRETGANYNYDELARAAEAAPSFKCFVDPDDARFLAMGDMPTRIRAFCAETKQPAPESVGEFMRCVYESLALKYRNVLEMMLAITGRTVSRIHIIGGGSQNALLCQMTADATGREVIAGPVEATALGNAIVQMITLGALESVEQARAMLARTTPTITYVPQNTAAWDEAYARFQPLVRS